MIFFDVFQCQQTYPQETKYAPTQQQLKNARCEEKKTLKARTLAESYLELKRIYTGKPVMTSKINANCII